MKIIHLTLLALLAAFSAQAAPTSGLDTLGEDFSIVDADKDGYISKDELSLVMGGSLDVQNEKVFEKLDVDSDGIITKEEYFNFYHNVGGDKDDQTGLKEKFNQLDSNHDDQISPEEMTEFRRDNLSNDVDDLFSVLDSDGDNQISQKEFDTFFNQMKQLLNM